MNSLKILKHIFNKIKHTNRRITQMITLIKNNDSILSDKQYSDKKIQAKTHKQKDNT